MNDRLGTLTLDALMGRSSEREGVPDSARIRLLEGDADRFEKMVDDLERALSIGFDKVAGRQVAANRLLLSLLVAVIASMVGVLVSGLVG